MDFCKYFKDKKITVMGLGLLGRGVGDAAYMAECGAEVTVTDLKSAEELKESLETLKRYDISYRLGEHRMEDFEDKDFILVAAGVPMDSKYVAHAREAGVPLKQSAALFAELSKIPIIGVTGTRGKSTVTHMIHHVLSQTTEGSPVLLGGNVRGVSNLQLLKEVQDDSLAVMELDSWQLQGFGWAEISPLISVFTNFMDDHLNYYKGDRDAYFKDKANIFIYQEESGTLITIPEVFEQAKKLRGVTLGQEVVFVDDSTLPEDCLLAMPGKHNRLNAALAYEALKATSLPEEFIMEGLASFSGVPGRLELLREVDGVKIYNDNNATTPAATIAALDALGKDKNLVLIVGGSDKELQVDRLAKKIKETCKHVVLLPGTGTDKLLRLLESGMIYHTVEDALKAGIAASKSGDVLLFSPGFASFGMFKNEYERGDLFVHLVNVLTSEEA